MSTGRHSYVAFYPSDWIAGTARMTRDQRAIYFDICCYNWDKAEPCPDAELPLMLGDIPNWKDTLELLIAAGKLVRSPDGILNEKALSEAKKAYELWEKKSKGGKKGAAKTNTPDGSPDDTPAKSPDKTPGNTPDETGVGVPAQNQNQNQKDSTLLYAREDVHNLTGQVNEVNGSAGNPARTIRWDAVQSWLTTAEQAGIGPHGPQIILDTVRRVVASARQREGPNWSGTAKYFNQAILEAIAETKQNLTAPKELPDVHRPRNRQHVNAAQQKSDAFDRALARQVTDYPDWSSEISPGDSNVIDLSAESAG